MCLSLNTSTGRSVENDQTYSYLGMRGFRLFQRSIQKHQEPPAAAAARLDGSFRSTQRWAALAPFLAQTHNHLERNDFQLLDKPASQPAGSRQVNGLRESGRGQCPVTLCLRFVFQSIFHSTNLYKYKHIDVVISLTLV